jgi:hypothetical protein
MAQKKATKIAESGVVENSLRPSLPCGVLTGRTLRAHATFQSKDDSVDEVVIPATVNVRQRQQPNARFHSRSGPVLWVPVA